MKWYFDIITQSRVIFFGREALFEKWLNLLAAIEPAQQLLTVPTVTVGSPTSNDPSLRGMGSLMLE